MSVFKELVEHHIKDEQNKVFKGTGINPKGSSALPIRGK